MRERLDITNPEVLEVINQKFIEKEKTAKERATKNANGSLDVIKYYQSRSYEEICEDVRKMVKEKVGKQFAKMDKETILRNAIILAFKNKGKTNVPEEAILYVMGEVTPEIESSVIKKYKDIVYKEELRKEMDRTKGDYNFYSKITGKGEVEYATLFQEMSYAKGLLDAKIESIEETAKEFGVEVPMCLENMETIKEEGIRIIDTKDANENEKSFISRIKETCKKLFNHERGDETSYSLSGTLSILAGAISFVAYTNQKAEAVPATLIAFLTSAVVMAACVTTYNADNIRSFFKDKKTLEEANKLGLLDLFVNWGKASKAIDEFNEKIKNSVQKEGGSHGLY